MKIEAKLLASAEDTRIKKIRAPNFFIFSTNTEKTLFGAEPPGGLLKILKKLLTRAFTNSDLAEFSQILGQTNFSHASAWFVCPFPSGKSGVQSKIMSQGVTEPIFR